MIRNRRWLGKVFIGLGPSGRRVTKGRHVDERNASEVENGTHSFFLSSREIENQ
jgi:hypothetical protein